MGRERRLLTTSYLSFHCAREIAGPLSGAHPFTSSSRTGPESLSPALRICGASKGVTGETQPFGSDCVTFKTSTRHSWWRWRWAGSLRIYVLLYGSVAFSGKEDDETREGSKGVSDDYAAGCGILGGEQGYPHQDGERGRSHPPPHTTRSSPLQP